MHTSTECKVQHRALVFVYKDVERVVNPQSCLARTGAQLEDCKRRQRTRLLLRLFSVPRVDVSRNTALDALQRASIDSAAAALDRTTCQDQGAGSSARRMLKGPKKAEGAADATRWAGTVGGGWARGGV